MKTPANEKALKDDLKKLLEAYQAVYSIPPNVARQVIGVDISLMLRQELTNGEH